nr:hypothetical protein EUGRSUZ_A00495 [Ipomoea batatas]
MAAHNNSPNIGFLHRRGTVGLSFQARRSSEINTNFVAIEVSLHHSSGLHLDAYLGNQFHHWMSALSPRVCGILSHYIVHSARWIGLANGGGTVVTASIEILDRERPLPIENNVVDFFPHRDASSSKPRGLSVEEIKKLKEERFKNGSDELSPLAAVGDEGEEKMRGGSEGQATEGVDILQELPKAESFAADPDAGFERFKAVGEGKIGREDGRCEDELGGIAGDFEQFVDAVAFG